MRIAGFDRLVLLHQRCRGFGHFDSEYGKWVASSFLDLRLQIVWGLAKD
jgi:hypothetical protein